MATRSKKLADDTLFIRMTDYFIQSTIAINFLVNNGLLGPTKRELHFILETGIKFLVTDQALPGAGIEEKNQHLSALPDRFRETGEAVELPGFTDPIKLDFRTAVLNLYGSLSTIVHASQAQVASDLQKFQQGIHFGFETISQVNRINSVCLEVFDIAVVLALHSIGLGLAGDIFVTVLDDEPKWIFHNTRFTKELSRHFDYKVERRQSPKRTSSE
ncbi:MAG: hypothetical protein CMH76_11110 [Nitrospinae bacterium]|nr:hypothetical protein [Nitrospinota bacterium]